MKAEIITIGTEILLGQTVDTNSAWLGKALSEVGVEVQRVISISDNSDAIIKTLDEILSDTNWVIITGGLGPTKDDITKKVLAKYFNDELVYRPEIFEHIKDLFSRMGRVPNSLNKEQAYFPKKANILNNTRGTAQCMLWEHNEVKYISLPGVPYEMKGIVKDHILPKMVEQQDYFIENRYFLVQGIPESDLALRLTNWEGSLTESLSLAYLPSPGLVKLRLTCRGGIENSDRLLKELDSQSIQIREILGKDIFTESLRGIEYIISELFKKSGQTLATAESFTGGNIAAKITSVPGSSEFFKGSVVAYSNEIKILELGVNDNEINLNGPVSETVALQMANGIKSKYQVDWSIATTGYAGPIGGQGEAAGTVWLAILGPQVSWVKKFSMGINRERTISKSCLEILNELRLLMDK